jgi:RNA polymerase-interacting CarD/CdnL/TRCF family regulator
MSEIFFKGDIIVDNFGIYEITEIKPSSEIDGKSHILACYTSALKGEKKYTSYIPINNFKKAGIRKALSTEEASLLLKDISRIGLNYNYTYNLAKDDVYFNDPQKSIEILRYIWINKEMLSTTDKELMEKILENLSREIAFVTGVEQNDIREEITKRLNKLS